VGDCRGKERADPREMAGNSSLRHPDLAKTFTLAPQIEGVSAGKETSFTHKVSCCCS
jgi:hypothetical protein